MGGFSIPPLVKELRKDKQYLLLGLRLNRDTERMVMADIIYAAHTPPGWVLIAEPNPSHQVLKSGNKVVLTSYGLRCQTVGSVDYANKNCGTSGETW